MICPICGDTLIYEVDSGDWYRLCACGYRRRETQEEQEARLHTKENRLSAVTFCASGGIP